MITLSEGKSEQQSFTDSKNKMSGLPVGWQEGASVIRRTRYHNTPQLSRLPASKLFASTSAIPLVSSPTSSRSQIAVGSGSGLITTAEDVSPPASATTAK